MAVGFQALDASGTISLDLTGRVLKILGTANIGTSYTGATASGTITDANFTAYTGCTSWVAPINAALQTPYDSPYFSISGNVLTWTFPAATRPNTTFIYGIF